MTHQEFTIQYYSSEIANYKTPSSKKAFLTRSKKEVTEYLQDQQEAYNSRSGYLHGERVKRADINDSQFELNHITKLYNTL